MKCNKYLKVLDYAKNHYEEHLELIKLNLIKIKEFSEKDVN